MEFLVLLNFNLNNHMQVLATISDSPALNIWLEQMSGWLCHLLKWARVSEEQTWNENQEFYLIMLTLRCLVS